MFNFNIKAIDSLNKLDEKSIVVNFFIDDNTFNAKLDEYSVNNNLKLNSVIAEKLKSKDETEISIQGYDDKPYLTVIKKIKFDKKFNNDFFRDYFAGFILKIGKDPIKNLYLNIPAFESFKDYFISESYYLQTFLEGLFLGNYTFDKYKSAEKEIKKLNVYVVYEDKKSLISAIKTAENIINGVYFSRDLTNEIPEVLTPQEMVKQAKAELNRLGITVKVFTKEQLEKMGMNGIVSVGRASTNPPLMMVLEYKPKLKAKKKIALVGKGVTYDAGGLSIKTTSGMLDMKADMAGASVVLGSMKAVAAEKLPVHVIGIVPAVENVISGNAFKPGDVIKMASGKTVEVVDTDAEGRLILADALHYACKQKPDHVIDYATLTGSVVVALGEFVAGLYVNDEQHAENLLEASKATSEKIWQMPMFDEYNSLIESSIADIKNLGSRWGGSISAAKFLQNFIGENISWAHIDLAGPALKHKLNNYTEKYHTGFGVRLTVQYLKDLI